jgi:hypothetical protein
MSSYFVPIDISTVRLNPDHKKRFLCIAGRPEKQEVTVVRRGSRWVRMEFWNDCMVSHAEVEQEMCPLDWVNSSRLSQPVQRIYCGPQPKWLYDHAVVQVACQECGATFSNKELESDSDEDADGNYSSSNAICPRCHAWECCELTHEVFDPTKHVSKET